MTAGRIYFIKPNLNSKNMDSERIKQIQMTTAYPESVSVMLALKQVWNECEQEKTLAKQITEIEVVKGKIEVCSDLMELYKGNSTTDLMFAIQIRSLEQLLDKLINELKLK